MQKGEEKRKEMLRIKFNKLKTVLECEEAKPDVSMSEHPGATLL